MYILLCVLQTIDVKQVAFIPRGILFRYFILNGDEIIL